jgi:hypothetical protein
MDTFARPDRFGFSERPEPPPPDFLQPCYIPSAADAAAAAGRETVRTMYDLMSGEATFVALKDAVEEIKRAAPEDHDVIIQAFNTRVAEVRFINPHTILFSGFDEKGNHASVVVHYSQVIARVVYLPKRGPQRVVTGFSIRKEDL